MMGLPSRCVLQEHESYYPTPPHSTPAVTDDERAVPVAVPVCVYCNMNVIIPPHPTPPQQKLMMKDHCLFPCLCVYWNMNVIIPPHPTPPQQ